MIIDKLPIFKDGTVQFYKHTTVFPKSMLVPGVASEGTINIIDKAVLMWKEEPHWFNKLLPGQWEQEDLGTYYDIRYFCYGDGYTGLETAELCLALHEAEGFHLVHSDGPKGANAQVIIDRQVDQFTNQIVPVSLFVGDRMKKLPEGWEKKNSIIKTRLSEPVATQQMEQMNNLSKKNLIDIIEALNSGELVLPNKAKDKK